MPIIKSAKKKMRKDAKLTLHNKIIKDNIRAAVKNARRAPSQEEVAKAASVLDKAVKVNFIHRNKANRLKSRLAALLKA